MLKNCLKLFFFYWFSMNLHQMDNPSFDWFSMGLPLFLRVAFRSVFAYKKRESPHSRKFLYNILNLVQFISIKLIITLHIGYAEFHKNFWKMANCLIWEFKLEYTDSNPPLKMEIRIVYTEGNLCKDTKYHERNLCKDTKNHELES